MMKQKATLEGRSLLFNVLFVILNLTGMTLIAMGNHPSFEESSMSLNIIGALLFITSTAGILIFQGRLLMSSVARVLVGGLFIVSGLVKANDPLGFSYKLEEYFEDGALAYRIKELFGAPGFSLEVFIDWALALSVIICIIEIVLGVLVIIGGKLKLTSYLLVLMMLFFTFLTWHTANCDSSNKFLDRDTYAMTDPLAATKIVEAETNTEIKIITQTNETLVVEEMKQPQCVDDCGCFGDAMKGSVGRSLTPLESMWKDIVVLYLVLWIFVSQWIIEPNSRRQNVFFTLLSLIVVTFFAWVFGWYFTIFFAFISVIGALWIKRAGGVLLGNYWGSILMVTLLSGIFVFMVLRYEPMKDYRPYAEGSNLKEKMNDGVEGVYQSLLHYKNTDTGEERFYDSSSDEYVNSKIWEDKKWEYVDMVQKPIVPTKIPSITDQFNPFVNVSDLTDLHKNMAVVQDQLNAHSERVIRVKNNASLDIYKVPFEEFTLEEYNEEDYTVLDTLSVISEEFGEVSIRDYIVDVDQIVVVTSKNISQGNWSNSDDIKAVFDGCQANNIPFVVICNGSDEQIKSFQKEYGINAPVFINDETELKAIARSNPSLMVIKKGIVQGKYPHRSIPTFEWLKENILDITE